LISTVLAKRYAKALFAVAKEDGKLEEYNQTLQELNAFLRDNPDIQEALESPIIGLDVKQAIIEELIKASNIDEHLANFLQLLVERNRVHHLPLIADAYQELMDEETGVIRARVTTAVPLSDDLKEKMREVFTQATGKEVVLVAEEDPSIIGGVIAHVGDMVWDGSIKSQLEGFKELIGRGEIG